MSGVLRSAVQLLHGQDHRSTTIFGIYFLADRRHFGRIKLWRSAHHLLSAIMLLEISFNFDSGACHSTFPFLIRATLAHFEVDLIIFKPLHNST